MILTPQNFRDLLDWFMCSDPWSTALDEGSHDRIEAMLDTHATEFGFENWVVAYHEFSTAIVGNAALAAIQQQLRELRQEVDACEDDNARMAFASTCHRRLRACKAALDEARGLDVKQADLATVSREMTALTDHILLVIFEFTADDFAAADQRLGGTLLDPPPPVEQNTEFVHIPDVEIPDSDYTPETGS